LKICFITEHFPPHIGGVEMMFKAYSSRLVKAGCEVKVLTSNSGGVMGESIEDGVEIHHFDWRSIFGHPLPNSIRIAIQTRFLVSIETPGYFFITVDPAKPKACLFFLKQSKS
jgi:hypothetical protein